MFASIGLYFANQVLGQLSEDKKQHDIKAVYQLLNRMSLNLAYNLLYQRPFFVTYHSEKETLRKQRNGILRLQCWQIMSHSTRCTDKLRFFFRAENLFEPFDMLYKKTMRVQI